MNQDRRPHKIGISLLFAIACGLLLGPSDRLSAQSGFSEWSGLSEKVTSYGEVDWAAGVVTGVGIGVAPPDAANATQAQALARRAALSVAYRNLLEAVKGVRVDSKTTVRNYTVTRDEIETRVQGLVHKATVINEQVLADGTIQVTVQMKISGELPTSLLPSPAAPPTPLFTDGSGANKPAIAAMPAEPRSYTGVVVNAEGLPVKPAMNPRIIMEDGRVAYGREWVDEDQLQDQTLVGYVEGMSAAKTHGRVTNTPLVIKALRAENSTDVVISDADAQTLHLVPEHLEFLERGKVVIALDSPK